MDRPFRDRFEAGQVLAKHLASFAHRSDVIVLGLPRGGVPVAYEVARALGVPMDVYLVRKLGVPGHEELAMGAIASGGVRILNEETVRALGIPQETIEAVAAHELEELIRREGQYRGDRPEPRLEGKAVILVDDGLATGSSIRAAIAAVRQHGPASIIVAVPVAAGATCEELRHEVEQVVCAVTPEPFYAVGLWYEDFRQTTDEEVHDLILRSGHGHERDALSPQSEGIAPTPEGPWSDNAVEEADL